MYSDEYFVPTVVSHGTKDSQIDKESSYSVKYPQPPVQEPSIYSQQHSKKSDKQSQKRHYAQTQSQTSNITNLIVQNQFSEQSQQVQSMPKSQSQSRPFTSEYTATTTYSQVPRSSLLDWDIQKVEHKKRDMRDKYQKGVKIQSAVKGQKNIKSNEYWHQNKVDTCAYITMRNGISLAVPAYKKNEKKFDNSEKFIYKQSLMNEKFSEAVRPKAKAGDLKKPLCKYDMNAQRNLLPQKPYPMPSRTETASQVERNKK